MARIKRSSNDFAIGIFVLCWAIADFAVGATAMALLLTILATLVLVFAYRRAGRPPPPPEAVVVPGIGKLAAGTAIAALGFGAVAASSASAGNTADAVAIALFSLVSLVLAVAFAGLRRTAAQTAVSTEGEPVMAQGMGRGGHGWLGSQVVVVTDRRILGIPAWPWGKPAVSVAIPFEDVLSFEARRDYLALQGERERLVLKKCPSPEVSAIANELRKHVPASAEV
ncbi:MAG TPA: hypothetical protein VIE64_00870 [Solirubrobacterales bacterium]